MAKFFGVGVGPGDPELITLKAKRVLETVDVVFVPLSKQDRESVAYNIVRPYLKEEISIIELLLPMSNDQQELDRHWYQAAVKIVEYLRLGQDVAFITLGDPLIYSTFGYLMQSVKRIFADAQIEIIPGITSYNAAAARTNTVLAEGKETLQIVPLPVAEGEWEDLLAGNDNLVLLKLSTQFQGAIEAILRHESKRGIYISRCGQPQEEIISDLNSLCGRKADYLSLMIVKNSN